MWIRATLAAIVCLTVPQVAAASKIIPLELEKLAPQSNLIVLGVVDGLLASDESSDTVSVRVISTIKGQTDATSFQLRLRNKGVKDFDPTLAVGDQCVFFLKALDDGQATLTYSGSIAVTPKKGNFRVP